MAEKDDAPAIPEKDRAPAIADKGDAGDPKPSMAEKDSGDDRNIEQRIRDQYAHVVHFMHQSEPTIDALMNLIVPLEQRHEKAKKEFDRLTEMMTNDPPIHENEIRRIEECIAYEGEVLIIMKKYSSNMREIMSEMKNYLREYEKDVLESEMPKEMRDLIEKMGETEKEEERAKKEVIGPGTVGASSTAEEDGADDRNFEQRILDQYAHVVHFMPQSAPTIDVLLNLIVTGVQRYSDSEVLRDEIVPLEQHYEKAKKEFDRLTEMMTNDPPIHESVIRRIEEWIAYEGDILIIMKKYSSNTAEITSEMKNYLREYEKDVPESEMPNEMRDLIEKMGGTEKEEERAKKEVIGLGTEGASSTAEKDGPDGMEDHKAKKEEPKNLDPSSFKKDDTGNIEEKQQKTDDHQ